MSNNQNQNKVAAASGQQLKMDVKLDAVPANAEKIIAALESMDHSDVGQWNTDKTPNLIVVRRMSGLADITDADIAAAAPGYLRDFAEPEADPDAGKAEGIGEGKPDEEVERPSPEAIQGQVKDARSEVERLTPVIEKMQAEISKANDAVAALQKERDVHLQVINREDKSGKLTDAIKRYQANNLAEAHKRAGAIQKLNAHLTEAGQPVVQGLSPLDQSLRRKQGNTGEVRKPTPMIQGGAVSEAKTK